MGGSWTKGNPKLLGGRSRWNQQQKRERQKRKAKAIQLFFSEGWTTKDIGVVVGVGQQRVATYIREAKEELTEAGVCRHCGGTGRQRFARPEAGAA